MLHTCIDIISSLDVGVTYLWWHHTLPGCWCYIPVLTSYPSWMLMLHTCGDIIPPWMLMLHTCSDVIPSLADDMTYLCWHHTLPGCWWAHTCVDIIPSLDVYVTYLQWCHTLPGYWYYIPVLTSYPPWMLMQHTCADVIPSLDVDEHVAPDERLSDRYG